MDPAVRISVERSRGCGYRKLGELYLVSDGPARPCCKLPIAMEVCPTCGHGHRPTRGWTWIDSRFLNAGLVSAWGVDCLRCPMFAPTAGSRVGLLWIRPNGYPSPVDFDREAATRGVNLLIPYVPDGFKAANTWVCLGHRLAVRRPDGSRGPGVFRVFRPDRVEIIVAGDESSDVIDTLLGLGLTPVKVIRDVDHNPSSQEDRL